MTARYLIASDSHGALEPLLTILERHPEAKALLFLGDLVRDAEDAASIYPDRQIISVAGNCDLFCGEPDRRLVPTAQGGIFMTHGHIFAGSEAAVANAAKQMGAAVAVYGHTHAAVCHYHNGIWIVNPGSLSRPRAGKAGYAIVDVTDSGITAHLVSF